MLTSSGAAIVVFALSLAYCYTYNLFLLTYVTGVRKSVNMIMPLLSNVQKCFFFFFTDV